MRPLSQFADFLTSNELDKLHDSALALLEDPGMRIENEQILRALRERGATVDFQSEVVRFPRILIEETIEAARKDEEARLAGGHTAIDAPNALTFSWHTAYANRTPEVKVSLGGGCPHYYDYQARGTRYATGDDFLRMVHLAEGLPEVATVGNALHYIKEPDGTDVPPKMVAIKGAAAVALHSSKPGCTSIIDGRQLDYLVEIGTIVRGSAEEYIRRPILVNVNDTKSPLQVTRPEGAIMWELARRGISIFIIPMPLAGILGPIYPIANAIIGVAEILGVWAMAKAVNENVPVEAQMIAGVLDPRAGTASLSAPEAVLIDIAIAQLFRSRYGVRCGTGAAFIDAAVPGPAAVFERMLKSLPACLAGEPVFPVGVLAGGLIFSPEQVMLDLDIARSLHALTKGIGGDLFTESLELIREGGIGGQFFDTEHTARHFRDFLWIPSVFRRVKGSQAAGSPESDPVEMSYRAWKRVLEKTKMYTIDDDRRRAIEGVVERAAKHLSSIEGAIE